MFSANSSQVSDDKLFVEDAFSTFVYTGNGSTQTITNGIDLAGKGGLWWAKGRANPGNLGGHGLVDTARGAGKMLQSNTTGAQFSTTGGEFVTSFNSNGVTIGNDNTFNRAGELTVGWTFRKAPKFFDVVTYTGNGTNSQVQNHSLGSTPGMIIVKQTSASGEYWVVWHRSLASSNLLYLNTTDAAFVDNGTRIKAADATTFTVGLNGSTGGNGATYVAYIFAHDTTSDGIIQCGSYTGNGSTSGPVVNLGWEPQWLLVKEASNANDWYILDTMRGWPNGRVLYTNLSNAEDGGLSGGMALNATGFQPTQSWTAINRSGSTYIYIAIRRGPMRTPTSGTSVFTPVVRTGTGTAATVSTGNVPDWVIIKNRSGSDGNNYSRLTGPNRNLYTNLTLQEIDQGAGYGVTGFLNSSFTLGSDANGENPSGQSTVNYSFTRAPSFFDEVCYSIPSAGSVNHNLGVVPEMMILKTRNASDNWYVYHSGAPGKLLRLNTTAAADTADYSSVWGSSAPTATQFSVGGWGTYFNYVWYGFASCPGVSKVFSFTGNGSSQTINCGFSSGARFILIKRTDSTGNWVTFDSARGIVSGNDPSLLLNSTAAETNYDDIDPDSSGFIVNQSTNNLNVNGASYVGIAIS